MYNTGLREYYSFCFEKYITVYEMSLMLRVYVVASLCDRY